MAFLNSYVDFDDLYIVIILLMFCLSFDVKDYALMIPLYLMKFDPMESMIGEWIYIYIYIFVLS